MTMLWSEIGRNDGWGVHSNVSHEFYVSLPRENVVKKLFASPVERVRNSVLGGTEKRI